MMDKLNGCFLIGDDKLLEKYNTTWEVRTDINKEFVSKPNYNNVFLKLK